jgi:hypothetical protein
MLPNAYIQVQVLPKRGLLLGNILPKDIYRPYICQY